MRRPNLQLEAKDPDTLVPTHDQPPGYSRTHPLTPSAERPPSHPTHGSRSCAGGTHVRASARLVCGLPGRCPRSFLADRPEAVFISVVDTNSVSVGRGTITQPSSVVSGSWLSRIGSVGAALLLAAVAHNVLGVAYGYCLHVLHQFLRVRDSEVFCIQPYPARQHSRVANVPHLVCQVVVSAQPITCVFVLVELL